MKTSEIRKKFLEFFAEQGHTVVPSSSLIPADDPTLLFANAGMNQFKDVFLGKERRSYTRAASSQKCVRAGGKHNDLDAVGFTERHLTFFEMLGNFSFGDYFKRDAITFAWQLLTERFGLDPAKLYPTVHTSDDEAEKIWREVIGDPNKIITRLGDASNFWQMGDTGPCGPCTEIFYDRGDAYGPKEVDIGGDNVRYIEIWNLVFMQFDRQSDGTLKPLAKTGVDTGAGLERVACVLQNKDNVYDTDAFAELRAAIEKHCGKSYATADTNTKAAFNVLCDHIRSTCLIIADGGMPSNEGRGYVLRKIIRRAALFAQKLSNPQLFLKLIPVFIDSMREVFPELEKSRVLISQVLTSEIDRFAESLVSGQEILKKYVAANTQAGTKELSGEQVFKLYDTYGYPVELSVLMAKDHGFTVDLAGFEREMNKQREQSGIKQDSSAGITLPDVPSDLRTSFTGYEKTEDTATITWAAHQNGLWFVVTDKTPFYVEAGGQVSDMGTLTVDNATFGVQGLWKVGGFTKDFAIVHGCLGTPHDANIFKVGAQVKLTVDAVKRDDTRKNHTATHLLQAALIRILGTHIKQAGSVVHPDYMRFDFVHFAPLSQQEIDQVEELVNQKIRQNITLDIKFQSLAESQQQGVIAFFGDKYDPERVRTIGIQGFSNELCGGTHVRATGDIGSFKIISEASVSNGVRRMVALTGRKAEQAFRESFNITKTLSETFKVPTSDIHGSIERLFNQNQEAQSKIKQLQSKLYDTQVPFWLDEMQNFGALRGLVVFVDNADHQALKEIAEKLAHRQEGLFVVASTQGAESSTISLVAMLSNGFTTRLNINLFADALKKEGLRCGGRNNMLQGGGVIKDKATFKQQVYQIFDALNREIK